MNEEFMLNQTIKRYDNEIERMRLFDTKAGNQIGYAGVIIAVLGFILGSRTEIISQLSLGVLIVGISTLLLSIGLSMNQLRPKADNLPVLKIREFYDDWKNNKLECDLIEVYFDHIDDMIVFNSTKLTSIHKIYCLTLVGLVISFIGIVSILIT